MLDQSAAGSVAGALQFAVLPVLVRGFAGAAFGVSVRTAPHGSEETLASGIFLSESR